MEWLNSTGGPLICAEQAVAQHWMGIDGNSSAEEIENDYSRTCRTSDYLRLLNCNAGCVIVLGDEPLQSTFAQLEDGSLAIIRWVYSKSAVVENFFSGPLIDLQVLSLPVPFKVTQGSLILFDSAFLGVEGLRANLAVGEYEVTSEQLNRESYSFIIHRFDKKKLE